MSTAVNTLHRHDLLNTFLQLKIQDTNQRNNLRKSKYRIAKPEKKNALILSECEAYFTKFSEKHFSVISLLHLQVHIRHLLTTFLSNSIK